MLSRFVPALVLLAFSGLARAELPKPAEFYFDTDASAVKPLPSTKTIKPAEMDRLLKTAERNPRALEQRVALAHLSMEGGNSQLGRQFYDGALAQMDNTYRAWRSAQWNYAWDLYRLGDAEGALAHFEPLVNTGGKASWMPPTLALVLWKLGRKDQALQWYAAAVRSEPDQWRDTGRYAELLPAWTDDERALLAAVQQAWAANPPRWP